MAIVGLNADKSNFTESDNFVGGNYQYYGEVTVTADCTVDEIGIGIAGTSSASNIKLFLMDSSGNLLVESTDQALSIVDNEVVHSITETALTAGTYIVGFISDGYLYTLYDADPTTTYYRTAATYPTITDPADFSWDGGEEHPYFFLNGTVTASETLTLDQDTVTNGETLTADSSITDATSATITDSSGNSIALSSFTNLGSGSYSFAMDALSLGGSGILPGECTIEITNGTDTASDTITYQVIDGFTEVVITTQATLTEGDHGYVGDGYLTNALTAGDILWTDCSSDNADGTTTRSTLTAGQVATRWYLDLETLLWWQTVYTYEAEEVAAEEPEAQEETTVAETLTLDQSTVTNGGTITGTASFDDGTRAKIIDGSLNEVEFVNFINNGDFTYSFQLPASTPSLEPGTCTVELQDGEERYFVEFNGSTQEIELATAITLQNFKISLLVKTSGVSGTDTLISGSLQSQDAIIVDIQSTGIVRFFAFVGTSLQDIVVSTTAIDDDAWHLIEVESDGTNASITIDGNLEDSSTAWSLDGNQEIKCFASRAGALNFFAGSAADIKVEKNSVVTNSWALDEETATTATAIDSVGGNDGTYINSPTSTLTDTGTKSATDTIIYQVGTLFGIGTQNYYLSEWLTAIGGTPSKGDTRNGLLSKILAQYNA